MKSNVENINSVQRKVTITIPAEKVAEAFDTAYKRIRMKAKIPGFRPGKAPLNVIKKSYGTSVSGEVGEKLVNDNLFKAISDNDIRPIASPVIESLSTPNSDKDFEFSALVDVMPAIELKGHNEISIDCKKYEVGDDSLDRELGLLARRQAKTKAIENVDGISVGHGHLAMLTHSAKVDGKEMPEMDVQTTPVAIGKKEVFAELENGIIGMKKGEEKDIAFTLPNDFQDETLAGKNIEFHVKIDDIMELELPTIDDELAKDINFESLEDLKKRIIESLEQNVEDMQRKELEGKLLDALRTNNDFDVPPSMTDQVIDGMISEVGINDEKMKKRALADTELRKGMLPEAKKRAQNTILLWEVAKAEKIQISDEDVKSHIKEFLAANPQSGEASDKKVEETFKSVGDRVRENLLLEKSLEFLTSSAKISYTSVKI